MKSSANSLLFVQAPFTPSIGVALYADFNLLRDEGGFGQSQRRLLLSSFSLISLRSRPSSLSGCGSLRIPALCSAESGPVRARRLLSYFYCFWCCKYPSGFTHPLSLSWKKSRWQFLSCAGDLLPLPATGSLHEEAAVAVCIIWSHTVSDSGVHAVAGVGQVSSLKFCPQRLAVCKRAVPQTAQGQWNAHVSHTKLGTGQLKQLGGPVWAAGWPALAEHEEGILHQHLHTHLEMDTRTTITIKYAYIEYWHCCLTARRLESVGAQTVI